MIWAGVEPGPIPKIGLLGWLRLVLRVLAFGLATIGLVLLWALAKLLEKLVGGQRLSGGIVRLWAWCGHRLAGLKLEIVGEEMTHGGALVANHASWLDIFVLHSAAHIHFVSKAEVARWLVIGWLARMTGTLFIERRSTEAKRQQAQLVERITAGDKLCFFPEATTTDGVRVLPFKSTLFSVFHTEALRELVWVQPVTVTYFPAKGKDKRFYGCWGDMGFGAHAMVVLALSWGGKVRVTYHAPLKAADYTDRKELAKAAGEIVRDELRRSLGENFEENT